MKRAETILVSRIAGRRRLFRRNALGRQRWEQPRRRNGFAVLTILIELVGVGLVACGIAYTGYLTWQQSSQTFASPDQMGDSIYGLGTMLDGRELWLERGHSEILAIDLVARTTRSLFRKGSGVIVASSVSRDKATVMVCTDQRELLIFRNQELLVFEELDRLDTRDVVLSGNGETAVRISSGTTVRCWDVSSPNPVPSEFDVPEIPDRIAIDARGKKLIVSTIEGAIGVYDIKTGALLQTLAQHPRAKRPLVGYPALSEDGRWLAVIRWGAVSLYDLIENEVVWTSSVSMSEQFHRVAISDDGRWVAASGMATFIDVFNAANGQRAHRLSTQPVVLGIAFCPSSDRLYAWSMSGFVCVWEMTTGQERDRITLH